MGIVLLYQGEPSSALSHLSQSATLYDFRQHSFHVFTYGQDPGVCCQIHEAWALWFLGYPDQALKKSLEALSLAQEVAHPYSLAFALHYVALIYQFRRENLAAQKRMEELLRFAKEREFPFWLAMASIAYGGEQTRQAAYRDEGITRIREGIATHRLMGADIGSTYWLLLLVGGYRETKQIEEGLQALDGAFAVLERTGEQAWEAELYRLKGELTLQKFQASPRQVQNKSRTSHKKSIVP